MNIINFTKANCKNCYKCVRSCPVKAIRVKDEQAEIVVERCIGCGQCLHICPQNAKSIRSDLKTIKKWIMQGEQVVASIAPSFAGAFDVKEEGQLITALKNLGFKCVEETAVGAELVSEVYGQLYDNQNLEHMITTSCATINYYIERYYPQMVKYMAPVVSPMIVHGKILKQRFGKEVKTVFIGPCISKKFETLHFQHDDVIDAIITFDELYYWLEEEGILLKDLSSSSFDTNNCNHARWYPLAGGVAISALKNKETGKKVLKADGIENCIDLLSSIDRGEMENTWIELNACEGGCINGPGMLTSPWGKCTREERVKKYLYNKENFENDTVSYSLEPNELYKTFIERPIDAVEPKEEGIVKILREIGKHKKEDELNCGGCGYNTCREKAIAVCQGMAEKYMCLPYMRSRGETLSNFITENTPNAIIVLDENFHIMEFNHAAETLFRFESKEVIKKPIEMIMKNTTFEKVNKNKTSVYRHKRSIEEYEIVVIETVLFIKEQALYLGIFTDVTQDEKNKEAMQKMRENTLNMAQEVIDKQMRVAQEIASLLGETTAQTKVTLTQLKDVVQGQKGDI